MNWTRVENSLPEHPDVFVVTVQSLTSKTRWKAIGIFGDHLPRDKREGWEIISVSGDRIAHLCRVTHWHPFLELPDDEDVKVTDAEPESEHEVSNCMRSSGDE